MRVLVLGSLTPLTARPLWHLLAAGHEIDELWIGENSSGVWRRRDRHLRWLAPTWSVEAAVRRCGVRVRSVGALRRNPAIVASGCRPNVDAVLVSCFPYLVPPAMLEYYQDRAFNLHPALLPRYRGARPLTGMLVDEALDASGVTLHVMSSNFDEGDVVAQQPVAWPADGRFRSWEADLAEASGRLAIDGLPRFLAGSLSATPQTGPANYIRSLPRAALTIGRHMDERRARWLASSLGQVLPLSVEADGGFLPVATPLSSQGSPTGEAPRTGWRRVDCDVADARLSLRRWDRWHRQLGRLRELASLAHRPLVRAA